MCVKAHWWGVLVACVVKPALLSSLPVLSVITALDMEAMVSTVKGWQENPVKFARSHGVSLSPETDEADSEEKGIHILIVEGFLIYNYK